MSFGFSTNQYESAFKARPLLNWHVPRKFVPMPKTYKGFSQAFANDRGHLLPAVPKSVESPWGTFLGTWDMPLKIPPPNPRYTGRSHYQQKKLKNWRDKTIVQHACNGFLEFPTNYPSRPTSAARPETPSPTHSTPPQNLADVDIDVNTLTYGRAGFTPGPHAVQTASPFRFRSRSSKHTSKHTSRHMSRIDQESPPASSRVSRRSKQKSLVELDAEIRAASRLSQREVKVKKPALFDRYTDLCMGEPSRTATRNTQRSERLAAKKAAAAEAKAAAAAAEAGGAGAGSKKEGVQFDAAAKK